jgi:hypothetical protein
MSKFNIFIKLYGNTMPFITLYSTFLGIDIGFSKNRMMPEVTSFDKYSNLIGYTSLGIITGVTYPISYPLFGLYVVYKN